MNTENLRLVWQRDLDCEISKEKWHNIVSRVDWATRDIRSKYTNYKIICRYYYTPMKLFRMGLVEDKRCWKCKRENGTFLHAILECPVVFPLWKDVLRKLGDWDKGYPSLHCSASWEIAHFCHKESTNDSMR